MSRVPVRGGILAVGLALASVSAFAQEPAQSPRLNDLRGQ